MQSCGYRASGEPSTPRSRRRRDAGEPGSWSTCSYSLRLPLEHTSHAPRVVSGRTSRHVCEPKARESMYIIRITDRLEKLARESTSHSRGHEGAPGETSRHSREAVQTGRRTRVPTRQLLGKLSFPVSVSSHRPTISFSLQPRTSLLLDYADLIRMNPSVGG